MADPHTTTGDGPFGGDPDDMSREVLGTAPSAEAADRAVIAQLVAHGADLSCERPLDLIFTTGCLAHLAELGNLLGGQGMSLVAELHEWRVDTAGTRVIEILPRPRLRATLQAVVDADSVRARARRMTFLAAECMATFDGWQAALLKNEVVSLLARPPADLPA